MHGRQWSDGLHQAVEAKHARDGVRIKEETQTLATITLQNFFRMYKKLAGMTGTAMTGGTSSGRFTSSMSSPSHEEKAYLDYGLLSLHCQEQWKAVEWISRMLHPHRACRLLIALRCGTVSSMEDMLEGVH